jgi:hypothetical protein
MVKHIFLIFVFFVQVTPSIYGQKTEKKNIVLNDTILSNSSTSGLRFENINKVPYYRNEKALKKIRSLDKQENWEELYVELKDYVLEFGIANFYTDTYLIWRLAKLTEIYGSLEESKHLYRLVLRHHREDINIKTVEMYYDSLTRNEQSYYVPIEYYYELIDYRKEVDTLRPPRGVLLNMGSLVNSGSADYGPALNGSGCEAK